MSVFFGLDTEAYDRQYSDQELIRRVLSYFAPHRRRVWTVGLLIAAIAGAGAVQPLIVARGLDLLVASPTQAVIVGLVAAVLVISVLNWWC
jgi:riboflavin transporter FmnP